MCDCSILPITFAPLPHLNRLTLKQQELFVNKSSQLQDIQLWRLLTLAYRLELDNDAFVDVDEDIQFVHSSGVAVLPAYSNGWIADLQTP